MGKRDSEKRRQARNLDYIQTYYGGDILYYDGKKYTQKQLAKRGRRFIDDAILANQERILFDCGEYLAIAWANHVDDFDFQSHIEACDSMSIAELKQQIHSRYKTAEGNVSGGSADMLGFYMLYTSNDKRDCVRWLKRAEKRGYAYGVSLRDGGKAVYNLSDSNIVPICVDKYFTQRGMLSLMHTIMHSTKNADAKNFYEDMYIYTMNNPRFHRLIFGD